MAPRLPQVKQGAGSKHKHIRFLLVDTHGKEYLAVDASDQGDAHYTYVGTPPFAEKYGALTGHTRPETLSW